MCFSTNGLSGPPLPEELKTATIFPSPPAGITSWVQEGVVQPQDARTLAILTGPFPVFLNAKMCSILAPSTIFPKSAAVSSKVIEPLGALGSRSSGFDFMMSSVVKSLLFGVQENKTNTKRDKNHHLDII